MVCTLVVGHGWLGNPGTNGGLKKNGKTSKNRQNPPVPVWLINNYPKIWHSTPDYDRVDHDSSSYLPLVPTSIH